MHPSQVEILGQLFPTVPSLSGMMVTCFVVCKKYTLPSLSTYLTHNGQGFVHPSVGVSPHTTEPLPNLSPDHTQDTKFNDALPSITLASLRPSPPEVSELFHLPLAQLVDPTRIRLHALKNRPPYWAIDVTEHVLPTDEGNDRTAWQGIDEVGNSGDPAVPNKVEVWGLTAWYINEFMRRLNVY